MRGSIRSVFFVIVFLGLLLSPTVYGQGGATGAVSGTVLDVNGGSVADAEVQIINSATNTVVRKLNAGSDGAFVATLLPPGSYVVVVNKSGFSESKSSIDVRVTETTRLSVTLRPGT